MLLFYCWLLITIINGSPLLELVINEGSSNGNNFYSINVDGKEWLQSGQLEGYFNNQWYTSNATTAQNNKNYQQMNMISSSTINDHSDDFGGFYSEKMYEWQAGTVIFQTNFKIYNDGKAISFVQSYPNGASGTAFMDTPIPNSCGGSQYEPPPTLSFPSFNVINKSSQYANQQLGYLTWTNTFSTATYGKAPLSSGSLAGINGGPVVLFDDTDINSIVIAPNDNFGVSTQINNFASTAVATYMYDSDRNDSLLCISSACYEANDGYTNRQVQGSGSVSGSNNELIALTLWYSDKYSDNYVASTSRPPDSTYDITFNNGYIYKNNINGSMAAVDLYYNKQKMDHATVASQSLKNQLISSGYKFIGTQGYIPNNTMGEGNNDWRMGIAATVLEIPAGFKHETVIVIGNGINNVLLNEYSPRLLSLYHTSRLDGEKDIVTAYLGYWTDDGAYYYGDDWHGATGNPMNLTCCSLEVFKDVKANLDKANVPIQYWQMDDWWYIGNYPGDYWGGVKAVQHWEPPPAYYPGGLAALSDDLQVPLLLYGPYFAPDNDWAGQFTFIPEGANYVLPSPEDSYKFYSALLDFGINATTTGVNTGMVGYEVDFMSCLSGTPEFRTKIGAQQQWLDGMNQAAKERGLPIQYCMATPMDLMQSLSESQVTNGRASGDYAAGGNWDIGAGSLLWSLLALKPSKDNFWTSFDEPYPSEFHPYGSDHNSTEVMTIIAIMTLGPVGISDRSGYTNATLIMRVCRADGRLLQPIRPITAIDDQFIQNVFNGKGINVWSTEYGPFNGDGNVDIIGHVVLAINMAHNYDLTYNSFTPSLSNAFMTIVRNWHNYTNCVNGSLAIQTNCIQLVPVNSKMLYTLMPQPVQPPMIESFELIHIIPNVAMSSIVFLGELDKYVSASQHRFNNLIIDGSSLSVSIKGKPNEKVSVSILKPNSSKNDWTFQMYDVMIGADGTTQFNIM